MKHLPRSYTAGSTVAKVIRYIACYINYLRIQPSNSSSVTKKIVLIN
jgi:hypothetical protein